MINSNKNKQIRKNKLKPRVAHRKHAPIIQEAETGGLQAQGQPSSIAS